MKQRAGQQTPSLRSGPLLGGRQTGAAMVYALGAVAVIGLLVSGAGMYADLMMKERRLSAVEAGRSTALEYVKKAAGSTDALYTSAVFGMADIGNIRLNQCVFGACPAGTGDRWNPIRFNLYVSYGGGPTDNARISGSAATNAAAYSHRGVHMPTCYTAPAPPNGDCPYYAETFFWAECAHGVPPCINPVSGAGEPALRIYVESVIRQYPSVTDPGGLKGKRFNQLPSAAKLNADKTPNPAAPPPLDLPWRLSQHFQVTNTADIRGGARQQCPPNTYMTGVDVYGTVTCKCDQGFRQTGTYSTTGWPICNNINSCAVGQVMAGTTAEGDAYCYTPPESAYTCTEYATPSTGVVNCPGTFWRMRKVKIDDECEVTSDNIVHCDYLKIICCTKT